MIHFDPEINTDDVIEVPADLEVESFVRCIRNAPADNRLRVFALIARDTRDRAKRQLLDRLWLIAEAGGLLTDYGVDAVQAELVSALTRGRR
jgi:hypothetical protein